MVFQHHHYQLYHAYTISKETENGLNIAYDNTTNNIEHGPFENMIAKHCFLHELEMGFLTLSSSTKKNFRP